MVTMHRSESQSEFSVHGLKAEDDDESSDAMPLSMAAVTSSELLGPPTSIVDAVSVLTF